MYYNPKKRFCIAREGVILEFEINIQSFQQVQDFVALACDQSFDIRVGNERQHINGKDLMGMFSLDFSRPLQVRISAEGDAVHAFRLQAEKMFD